MLTNSCPQRLRQLDALTCAWTTKKPANGGFASSVGTGIDLVGRQGLEPRTKRLRVFCSAN